MDGKKFIRGKSCPLAAITAHYPDACLIVEALLTEIIGVPVKEHCTHGQSPSRCFEVNCDAARGLVPRPNTRCVAGLIE